MPGEPACPSVMWGHAGRCQEVPGSRVLGRRDICCHLDLRHPSLWKREAQSQLLMAFSYSSNPQGLGGEMNRAFYQSLEFPGMARKGSLGTLV